MNHPLGEERTTSRDDADQAIANQGKMFAQRSCMNREVIDALCGLMLGETISETYDTELETLGTWMEAPGSRGVILEPRALNMGFAWFQENNGKIWWTLVMGGGQAAFPITDHRPRLCSHRCRRSRRIRR